MNGQQWFPNPAVSSTSSQAPSDQIFRGDFRFVVNFGELPNTGTKSVPHGLTFPTGTTGTLVRGCSTNTTTFKMISLPYSSPTLADNIELFIDGTNVTVITGSNWPNFAVTYVVIEFLKQ